MDLLVRVILVISVKSTSYSQPNAVYIFGDKFDKQKKTIQMEIDNTEGPDTTHLLRLATSTTQWKFHISIVFNMAFLIS